MANDQENSNKKQVKISLGEYYEDLDDMAKGFNMKLATFCAYCCKYFVDNFDGKSLPPLQKSRQRNLDI